MTVFRISSRGALDLRGAEQAGQNAKSSGLSRPQFVQVNTLGAYAAGQDASRPHVFLLADRVNALLADLEEERGMAENVTGEPA